MIRLPKEDGAWWMALTCWICGWAAALELAWEPLVLAAGVAGLFASAQAVRTSRRLWTLDRPAAAKSLAGGALAAIPGIAALVVLVWRVPDTAAVLAFTIPAALYAPFLLSGEERRPAARVLAVIALMALAPATHAVAARSFGAVSVILWASLGGYFLLGAVFVMARFRKSAPALWTVRLAATLAFSGALWSGLWIVSGAFLILAARAWAFRAGGAPLNPRAVGRTELAFSAAAACLVLMGIWLR